MNIFEGLHIKLNLKEYPTYVFFFKGDEFQMYYNWETKIVWCIWEGFIERYGSIHDKANEAIKKQWRERFKIQDVHIGITSGWNDLRYKMFT